MPASFSFPVAIAWCSRKTRLLFSRNETWKSRSSKIDVAMASLMGEAQWNRLGIVSAKEKT
jgi:hypothetical protein